MSTSDARPIRVLIVDDHQVVRLGLRTLLSHAGGLEVAGEASTAAEATQAVADLMPDVVLLDIRLPDGSGFDVCRKIQALPQAVQVLILTSVADDQMVLDAISAGADGYLLKEIDAARLVEAIKKVAAGQSILDPSVTREVFDRLRSGSGASEKGKLELLSVQERRVLALVAEGKTNKEIAVEMALSDKTVKNYLSNLLEKLQLTRRSQAAAYFVQHRER